MRETVRIPVDGLRLRRVDSPDRSTVLPPLRALVRRIVLRPVRVLELPPEQEEVPAVSEEVAAADDGRCGQFRMNY